MPKQMSEEHRQANKKARAENRAVSAYLQAIESIQPRPGRRPTKDSMQKQLDEIAATFDSATPLKRIQLIQRRMELEKALETIDDEMDITDLQDEFVQMVGAYSKRKGISYAAWREMGVPVAVLKQGGITRTKVT